MVLFLQFNRKLPFFAFDSTNFGTFWVIFFLSAKTFLQLRALLTKSFFSHWCFGYTLALTLMHNLPQLKLTAMYKSQLKVSWTNLISLDLKSESHQWGVWVRCQLHSCVAESLIINTLNVFTFQVSHSFYQTFCASVKKGCRPPMRLNWSSAAVWRFTWEHKEGVP